MSQQNRYLRGIQENTERLKDEKENLERQLERLSQVRRRIDELEFEVSQLRNEKARWTKFLEDNDDIGVDSPYTLSKSLAQQRLELAVVKEKLGQEEAKRAGRESYISRLEREVRTVSHLFVRVESWLKPRHMHSCTNGCKKQRM